MINKDFVTAQERITPGKRELSYLCEKAVKEEEESLRLLRKRIFVTEQNLKILNKKNMKLF